MNESVVHMNEIAPGIVQITMKDTVYKNTFSAGIISGLINSFNKINQSTDYKVVILTGYDTYFSSGGTKDSLLAIYDGDASFTDSNIYRLALDCPIPVISAVQGHGIGGGFVIAFYSDFVILSRESIYTTNFMRYGFTPGFGSTYILSQKLGHSLAMEMFFSARNYRGEELEKRGIPFPVVSRNEVMPNAIELARQIAEKPRTSLVTLKDHMVGHLRKELPEMIQKELAMHDKTFHQSEIKERIQTLFGN